LIEATCPDCRGPLTELRHEGIYEYRCLVGHRYSAPALLAAHSETQERALWSAVLALEESAVIARELAPQFSEAVGAKLIEQAQGRLQQASDIRAILLNLEPFHTG